MSIKNKLFLLSTTAFMTGAAFGVFGRQANAACDPDVLDGSLPAGTVITCTGTDADGFIAPSQGDIEFIIEDTATVFDQVKLGANVNITNNGLISFLNETGSQEAALTINGSSNVNNFGEVSVTGSHGTGIFGRNFGQITITNHVGGFVSVDGFRSQGITVSHFGHIINNFGEVSVTGENSIGIFASDGGGHQIFNEGSISASGINGIGVFLKNDSFLNNQTTGTISVSGDGARTVQFFGLSGTFENNGLVEALDINNTAISFIGSEDATLINNSGGIISGSAFAVKGGETTDTVLNSGTINGLVSLGGGEDHFENAGTINGDVDLGEGSDRFLNTDGTINGNVNLGGGDDLVLLDLDASQNLGTINGTLDAGAGSDGFGVTTAQTVSLILPDLLAGFDFLAAEARTESSQITILDDGTAQTNSVHLFGSGKIINESNLNVKTGNALVIATNKNTLLGQASGGLDFQNNASITTSGDGNNGVFSFANNTIVNNGQITTNGNQASGIRAERGHTITNAATGLIETNGMFSPAIAVETGNTVTNDGMISTIGDFGVGLLAAPGSETLGENIFVNNGLIGTQGVDADAVLVAGTGNTVTNNGEMQTLGTGASGVQFGFDNGTTVMSSINGVLVNNGKISASNAPGVSFVGTGDNLLVNNTSGEISGSTFSILGSEGMERVENLGTLNSDVVLNGGSDTVINAGTINGNVDLGAGDDFFLIDLDNGSGSITGTLDGGEGTDAFGITTSGFVSTTLPALLPTFEIAAAEAKTANSSLTLLDDGNVLQTQLRISGDGIINNNVNIDVAAGPALFTLHTNSAFPNFNNDANITGEIGAQNLRQFFNSSTGSLTGTGGTAFLFNAGDATILENGNLTTSTILSNSGTVQGNVEILGASGINLDTRIFNNGTLQGNIRVFSSSDLSKNLMIVTNSGTLTGGIFGQIDAQENRFSISNSGQIGQGVEITGKNAKLSFGNSGDVFGNVSLSTTLDGEGELEPYNFNNSGNIFGDVTIESLKNKVPGGTINSFFSHNGGLIDGNITLNAPGDVQTFRWDIENADITGTVTVIDSLFTSLLLASISFDQTFVFSEKTQGFDTIDVSFDALAPGATLTLENGYSTNLHEIVLRPFEGGTVINNLNIDYTKPDQNIFPSVSAIRITSGAELINNADVTYRVDAIGGGSTVTLRDDGVFINNGSLFSLQTNPETQGAFGVFLRRSDNQFINNGTILVDAQPVPSEELRREIAGVTSSFVESNSNVIINNGSITTLQAISHGIHINGFRNEIHNTGEILVTGSDSHGIKLGVEEGSSFLNSFDGLIVNSGNITSQLGNGILVIGDFTNTIINEAGGTISGNVHSILFESGRGVVDNSGTLEGDVVFDFQVDLLTNAGVITGDIHFGSGADILTNSGTVNGNVFLQTGSDSFLNEGTINGNVFLGVSADTFVNTNATINGFVDFQQGDDVLILDLDSGENYGTITGGVKGGFGNDTFGATTSKTSTFALPAPFSGFEVVSLEAKTENAMLTLLDNGQDIINSNIELKGSGTIINQANLFYELTTNGIHFMESGLTFINEGQIIETTSFNSPGIFGSAGADTFVNRGTLENPIDFGDGNDVLILEGGQIGGNGTTKLGSGDDLVKVELDDGKRPLIFDSISGGGGTDAVVFVTSQNQTYNFPSGIFIVEEKIARTTNSNAVLTLDGGGITNNLTVEGPSVTILSIDVIDTNVNNVTAPFLVKEGAKAINNGTIKKAVFGAAIIEGGTLVNNGLIDGTVDLAGFNPVFINHGEALESVDSFFLSSGEITVINEATGKIAEGIQIKAGDRANLINHGEISEGFVTLITPGDSSFINTGSVFIGFIDSATSGSRADIIFGAGNDILENSGLISGISFLQENLAMDILFEDGHDQFINTGDVDLGGFIEFSVHPNIFFGAGNDLLENEGNIFSLDDAARFGNILFETGEDVLINSGNIAISSIDFGAGNDTLTNTNGTISAEVSFGDGNDRLDNSGGTITGDVFFGAGSDTLINSGGLIDGFVDFGAGDDNFLLDLDTGANFGTITGGVNGGDGIDSIGVTTSGVASATLPAPTPGFEIVSAEANGSNARLTINDSGAPISLTLRVLGDGTVISNQDFDVLGSTAVEVTGDGATFENLAAVSSDGTAIDLIATNTTFFNSGSVFGGINAVLGTSGNDLVINDGALSGDVDLLAGDDTLNNSGTVNGDILFGDGNDRLENSNGTITGDVFFGAGSDTLLNNGQIFATIETGDGNDAIENNNTITGNTLFQTGNDFLKNAGTITGDVFLGAGSDTLVNSGGLIDGSVDFGAGDDNFLLDLDTGANFGTITGGVDGGDGIDSIGVTTTGVASTTLPAPVKGFEFLSAEANGVNSQLTINNSGKIIETGLRVMGTGTVINNQIFLVSGETGVEIQGTGTTFENVSTILSDETGVSINGSGTTFINKGDIFGSPAAIQGDLNDQLVINSGNVNGKIFLEGGNDVFHNSGKIGNIFLGAGADTLVNFGGTIRGEIDFGSGDDVLRLDLDENFDLGKDIVEIKGGSGTDRFELITRDKASIALSKTIKGFEFISAEAIGSEAELTLLETGKIYEATLLALGNGTVINNQDFRSAIQNLDGPQSLETAVEVRGDGLNFVNNGILTLVNNAVVVQGSDTTFTNNSIIEGDESAIVVNSGVTNTTIVNHGTISSAKNHTIRANGANNTLVNHGEISNEQDKEVAYTSSGVAAIVDNITNFGTINGMLFLGAGDDFVDNQGTIIGDVVAFDGNDTVINGRTGLVDGHVGLEEGQDTLDNLGTINGFVFGGSGQDFIINRGTIKGDVRLRDGNDTHLVVLDQANKGNANVGGVVFGDGGVDRYIVQSGGQFAFTFDKTSDFEKFVVQALGSNAQITLNDKGSVFGQRIIFEGGGTIVNHMDVATGGEAIRLHQNNTRLVNHGNISSSENITIVLGTGDGNTVENFGTITSTTNAAIQATGASTNNTLINNGEITNTLGNYVYFGSGNVATRDTVINNRSSTINGDVFLGAGSDFVDNFGTINGFVAMHDGNDIFVNRTVGQVNGNIFLGAGNDTLDLRYDKNFNLAFSAFGGAGFDRVHLRNWSGTHNVAAVKFQAFEELVKSGNGHTGLTGSKLIDIDNILVNDGILSVMPDVDGNITVRNGGNLRLAGNVTGNVVNQGIFSAGAVFNGTGSFLDTINISGNFTQNNTGKYHVDISGSSADLVIAGGNASLAGTLDLFFHNSFIASGTRYTILQTGGTVSGQFADFTTNSTSFHPTLFYNANNVVLEVNFASLQISTTSPNQFEMAGALDTLSSFNLTGNIANYITALRFSDQEAIPALLDHAGADTAANMATASLSARDGFLEELSTQAFAAGAAETEVGQFTTSFNQYGQVGSRGSAGNQFSFSNGGAISMNAFRASLDTVYGVAVGNSTSDFSHSGQLTDNDHQAFDVAGFLVHQKGKASLLGVLSIGHDEYDLERSVVVPGAAGNASASASSTTMALHGEARYDLELGGINIDPRVSFTALRFDQDGFTESGLGNLGLIVHGGEQISAKSSIGAGFSHTFEGRTERWSVTPSFGLFWDHEFGDTHNTMNAAFQADPSTTFNITGIDSGRNQARFYGGLKANFTDRFSASIRYDGIKGGQEDIHQFSARLNLHW